MSKDGSAFFSSLIEKGQFRVDDRGHALLFGEYLFLMPPAVVVKLQNMLEEEVGRDRMSEMMMEAGRYHIEQAVERHDDRYNLSELSRHRFLEYVDQINNVLGWGDVTVESLSKEDGIFTVTVEHPTFPAVYLKNHAEPDAPICHYLKGLLGKQFELLLSNDIEIEEKNCAALDGKKCVFEGKTKD